MAATVELDIAGLEGNMMAQPRIFAHDAKDFLIADLNTLLVPLPSGDETVFMQRGACLYIGVDMSALTVTMESGATPTFKNIPAGSFLPILVTEINVALDSGGSPVTNGDIVILW